LVVSFTFQKIKKLILPPTMFGVSRHEFSGKGPEKTL